MICIENIQYKEGLKEILSLTLAAMSLCIIILLSFFDVKADVFIKMMKMIYIVLLIVALFEIISGYHLPTSWLFLLLFYPGSHFPDASSQDGCHIRSHILSYV